MVCFITYIILQTPDSFMVSGVFGVFLSIQKGLPQFILSEAAPFYVVFLPDYNQTRQLFSDVTDLDFYSEQCVRVRIRARVYRKSSESCHLVILAEETDEKT